MASEDVPAGQKAQRTVAIVPHTHWDREWYEPFQAFRLKLVDLLDGLLPHLEADATYAHFLLDGQMAAVDDYLAVRPEAEGRLRRLVSSGRVALGPWYVLPDEFCVSGETLVRNLQYGLARAAELGGAMAVGYLPDTFGHAAQMPQILRLAGFDHAVVWRGVPRAVDRTAFRWAAPDGSAVRAEYLPVGYGNGAAVPDDAERLVGRVRAHEAELGPLLTADSALLWMNGTDHQVPQPWLGRVVAEANELQDEYQLVVASMPDYLAGAPTSSLPGWAGELRSAYRANLLPGVASNRVDVKQSAARAERALERRAEPLSALFLPAELWPERALGLAWLEVLRNAAHDSSCACSADEVVEAVLGRYREARQVADGLADRALAALGASMAVSGPIVVNPSARTRSGVVELVLPEPGPSGPSERGAQGPSGPSERGAQGPSGPSERGRPGAQVLSARPAGSEQHTVTGGRLATLIGQVANRALTEGGLLAGADVLETEDGVGTGGAGMDGLEVVLRTGPPGSVEPTVASDLAETYARAGARPDGPVRVRVEHRGFCRALVRVGDVPGFGWAALGPSGPSERGVQGPSGPSERGVHVLAEGNVMASDLVRVEVDPSDGTFAISSADQPGLSGLDRLVDAGDAGDTYNYSPPAADTIVHHPASVAVEVAEQGPLRAALRVLRTFVWPERVDDGRRVGERSVVVATRLELHAGERLVRVTTALDNSCRDHRLRTHFPLPGPATTSAAECAFTVVRRGLEAAEGGAHERGLATHPSRRFVSAGGLTVVHEGLLEYEVVDSGRALAITLLRCVGLLSGTELAYRAMPAGPPLPVPGAQMQGPRMFRYGVALDTGDPLDPYALVDDAFLPLEVTVGSGAGSRPATGSALVVEGAQVSAVRRVGGLLEVRVFNPTDHETTAVLEGRSGWLVDLRHRPLAPFDGHFRLRAHGIATVLAALSAPFPVRSSCQNASGSGEAGEPEERADGGSHGQ